MRSRQSGEDLNSPALIWNALIAGREYVSICINRALCDNCFELCMVLGMDTTFSKTTAHKLEEAPGGR